MKKILFTAFFTGISLLLLAQNQPGLPEIINYPKQLYNAGTQNWDMAQDERGIMYFANNEGLLSFDGTHWTTYPLPNKTIVRSLAMGPNHTIYVGGQEELGYFAPDARGRLQYHSLMSLIPAGDRSFSDVWDIVVHQNAVFFRSSRRIFQYASNRIVSFQGADWRFLGASNGKLIAQDAQKGLLLFQNGVWKPFIEGNFLSSSALVTGFLSIGSDSSVLTTLKEGPFLLTRMGMTKWTTGDLTSISAYNIYTSTCINKDLIVLATSLNGCYVVDKKGIVRSHFSRREGLQNNNVLSVFADKSQNLWMGLDNGIDFIAYNNAITHIYPDTDKDTPGYASYLYQNQLFLGTAKGLFKATLQPNRPLEFQNTSFVPVANTSGQVWNLSEVNGQLLMGHHEGSFRIQNNSAVPLDKSTGFWTFLPFSPVLPSTVMVAGTYNGIHFYRYANGGFSLESTAPFESARFVSVEGSSVWVSHPYKGIFRIKKSEKEPPQVISYAGKIGSASPNNNFLFKIKNQLVATTENGIFEYNPANDQFVPSSYFNALFGQLAIRYLKEDPTGNIWFVFNKSLGVVDLSGSTPNLIFIPELNAKIVSGFEHVNPVDANHIFVGAEKGFYLIDYEKYKQTRPPIMAGIRRVHCSNGRDSLLFGGYFSANKQVEFPRISHNWNTFQFDYSSTLFGQQENLEYSYRLKGMDKTWSEWTQKTNKEFTNLPSGTYTFEVKARNNLGNESAISSYTFKVLPPWYQSFWAIGVYSLLGILGIYILYRYQKKKFILQRKRHEEEQKKLQYLHQLKLKESEKKIVQLKNEKLEAEIEYKNKELASVAMHLVQKGEMIGKIREELVKIKKGTESTKPTDDFKKIIKILTEEEKMDKDWEHFSVHFDSVHSDFLLVMKQQYPNLTANELKLCAYLRMNLSTKEIAQLMNISVRGVEISRYRLRKKLEIPTEMNLFHFLLNVYVANGRNVSSTEPLTQVTP